jgi:drug/metabolite transporter (DMT)-like permease
MHKVKEKDAKIKPYFMLLLGVVASSFSAIFIRGSLNSGTPALIIAFYRLAISSIILIPYTLKYKLNEIVKITKSDIALSLLSGCFLALHFISWISSFQFTSTFGSLVLMSLQPIYVVIASYFIFSEKISFRTMIAGFIAILGSVIIGISDFALGKESLRGDILALLGGLFLAGYFLCGRDLRQRLSIFPYISLVYGSCTLILLIVGLVNGVSFYPYSSFNFLMFFALAVICTIFGHTVFNWALEYIPAVIISVALLGEPIGSGIWAFLIFKESLSIWHFVGGSIIILGLYRFTLEIDKGEKVKT